MNIFSPAEITANYADIGVKKCSSPVWKLLALGILAGFLIGMGGAVTNTAVHSITDVSTARVISGLLFPFGLGMVMLLGAELFTGNCMIPISVLEKKTSAGKMLRNWGIVYLGNFFGASLLAWGCAFFGQMDYSGGALTVYAIKLASAKCALPFQNALVLGIFCNILVCAGVLCALSAKDTISRLAGAYIPVAFFVICGFEHCVANMFYVPAGLFALQVPRYAALAAEAGINTETLTWGRFLLNNLPPVTLGNIAGGVSLGVLMWACNLRKGKTEAQKKINITI
jgi:formate/nitrite transporter